jgi:hypothetical protein
VSYCCEKLVAEVGDSTEFRGKGKSAVGCRYQATANEDCNRLVCPIVICEVRRTVTAESLLVVTSSKSLINPITNPSCTYGH